MSDNLSKKDWTHRPKDGMNRITKDNQFQRAKAWISNDLLLKTQKVWSKEYGRPVDEAEAIEILANIKNLAETLQRAKKEAAAK